ncbi:MAG: hypothetical protein MJZ63_09260, partial [Muribaculaceae bacterium]|nr:hypothetical protein [Muribaculaceae bacterium]
LSKDIKTLFLASNSEADLNKKFYYIFTSNSDGRFLLVLECTELFIVNILVLIQNFLSDVSRNINK